MINYSVRRFFLGLDLGQASDPTALAIIEMLSGRTEWPDYKPLVEYHLRFLKRYQLGTPYPEIVDDVRMIFDKPALRPAGAHPPVLVIDYTGVGRPVLDMMRKAGLDPFAMNITGGTHPTKGSDAKILNVPKRDLASTLQVLLQSDMLKFAKVQHLDILKKELLNFKVKISSTGQDTYEAWRSGDHDDMVLALAIACWLAHHGDEGGASVKPVAKVEFQKGKWKGFV